MKKTVSFAILCLSLILLLSCFCSCETYNQRLKRIPQVQPEVSYGYTAIGNERIVRNNQVFEIDDMVGKFVKIKVKNAYPYGERIFGNYKYFFYHYCSHKSDNRSSYDIGLFRLDMDTLYCELVYDFKDIYFVESYAETIHGFAQMIDENRAVIRYNGDIQVLDLQRKRIDSTAAVYDKNDYLNSRNRPCRFNGYGDCIRVVGSTLYYYKLSGNHFILHQYVINDEVEPYHVGRIDNYVYTYVYGQDKYHNLTTEYCDCYDLTTDQKVDLDILREEIANARKQAAETEEEEKNAYVVNGSKYFFDIVGGGLTISDEKKNQVSCIDEDFMKENSEKFMCFYNMYGEKLFRPLEYTLTDFAVVDDKIFVGFEASYGFLGTTPPVYIYEYNMENNTVKYVGFSLGNGIGTLRLHTSGTNNAETDVAKVARYEFNEFGLISKYYADYSELSADIERFKSAVLPCDKDAFAAYTDVLKTNGKKPVLMCPFLFSSTEEGVVVSDVTAKDNVVYVTFDVFSPEYLDADMRMYIFFVDASGWFVNKNEKIQFKYLINNLAGGQGSYYYS